MTKAEIRLECLKLAKSDIPVGHFLQFEELAALAHKYYSWISKDKDEVCPPSDDVSRAPRERLSRKNSFSS